MNKQLKVALVAIIMVAGLILWSSLAGKAQERIDDWYGREMTELHQQLKADGDKFKYKDYGNDKVSLTMTDYREVECEYISLDGGYTVKYRVDHYTKKEYARRVDFIKRKWQNVNGYYILRGTVVAMFDNKRHRIGFTLHKDVERRLKQPYKGEIIISL